MHWLVGLFLIVIAALPSAALATGGGPYDSDIPWNTPQVMEDRGWSEVTMGDSSVVIIEALDLTIGPFPAASLDDVVSRLLGMHDHVYVGGGAKPVVVDNGAAGGTLTTEWQTQDGVSQKVESKKGASEDEDDFVKRHVATVRLLQKAFPPG